MNARLQTERLWFREMGPGDASVIHEILSDDLVTHYFGQAFTRSDADAWIERQCRRYNQDGFAYWLAMRRGSDEVIGQAGLLRHDTPEVQDVGLGYIIHGPFRRQGFALEAARGIIRFAFAMREHKRVVSLIRPMNEPSRGVAEKAGMTPGRTVQHCGFDHIVYGIDRAGSAAQGIL